MEAYDDDDHPRSPSDDDETTEPKRRKTKDADDDHSSGGDHRKLKNREAAALSRRRNKDRMEQLQRRVFDMESMNTRLKALVDELQWKMVSHGLEREVHECHAQAGIVVNGNHIAMQSPRRKPKPSKPSMAKEPVSTPKAAFPSPHTAPMRPQLSEQRLFPPPNAAPPSSRPSPYMYPPLVPPPREYAPRQEVQLESHVSALLGLQFSQPMAKPEPPPPSSYPPFPYPQYQMDQAPGYIPYRSS